MRKVRKVQRELATAILLEWIVQIAFESPDVAGIPKLQWSIMRSIQQMPADRCDAQHVARYLSVPHTSVSRELRKMRLQGLVRVERSEKDKRVKLFTLTSSGISTSKNDPTITIAHAIGRLSQGEREKFEQSVQQMALWLFGGLGSQSEKTAALGERSGLQ